MPSLRFPDTGTRMAVSMSGRPAVNTRAYIYADEACTIAAEAYADVNGTRGGLLPVDQAGRRYITLSAFGEQPYWWGPADGTAVLWLSVNGVVSRVNADYGPRLDSLAAQVGGAETPTSAQAKADAAAAFARQRANHTGTQATSTITGLDSALAAKAPLASPTFTGTVSGVTKTHVGLGNVDNTADLSKPVSTAQLAAIETFGVRANDPRFGTPGTRQAFINAIDAAEAKGNNSIVYIPAGLTIDVGEGLSMSGRTVQIVGAGAGLSGATPLASVIRASTQTGPVLDYTGYVDPSNFMGKVVPLSNVVIKGSNVADPTKNNSGIRLRSMQSATFRDISIMHTGGPCLEGLESPGDAIYLCDFERIIMTTPVNAGANDVPYFYANECNGNRFYGFGFRSLTTTNNVGPSGAAIVESNQTTIAIPGSPWAPRFNLFDAWWFEYLHPGPGGTLFSLAGNTNIIRDFQYFDVRMETGAAGTGTSYIRLKSAAPALNLGGNIVRGLIPGDQGVTTFIDTGIDVRQPGNRIEGVKGYRSKNVTIAAGVDYTYVHLAGAESGAAGAPAAVVNNSAATHNVIIDEVNGDEWRNGGWVRQNGISTESGGAPNIQTFTSSGTWTKPAGAVTVQITAIGAGGGGGSGRRGADGTACSGGGGGGGGALVSVTFPASALSASHAVTVGSGGAGGPAVTTDDTNGTTGTNGGNCVVAGLLVAYGGLGGGGGNNSTGQAGASLTPATANGGFGNTTAGGSSGNAVNGAFGGAGGGGINTSNVAANGGAQGFATYAQGVTSGAAGVVDGAPAGNGNNAPTGSPLPGGGAGGGAASVTTAAGAGGNGGRYGCGGGGGGASRNGNNSGKGGDGAGGIVQIITTF